MIKGIKKFSVKKNIEKHFSLRKNEPLINLNRIGLIVDANFNEQRLIKVLSTTFSLNSNQLSTIVFKENKGKEIEGAFFTEKDIDWRGVFKKESEVKSFLAQDFDLLINYFSRDNLALLLVAASAEAKLKAGFSHQEKRLNDMEILVQEEEPSLFVKEIKKYTDIIIK